jgi:hypothetical protein
MSSIVLGCIHGPVLQRAFIQLLLRLQIEDVENGHNLQDAPVTATPARSTSRVGVLTTKDVLALTVNLVLKNGLYLWTA